jgi:hypothetical protein
VLARNVRRRLTRQRMMLLWRLGVGYFLLGLGRSAEVTAAGAAYMRRQMTRRRKAR